jgi:hypothetical protein
MTVVAIGSFALGVLLGAGFRFYILVPAISLVVLLFIFLDLVHGSDLASAAIHSAVAATGIQLGYLGAAFCCSWGSRLTSHRVTGFKAPYGQAQPLSGRPLGGS